MSEQFASEARSIYLVRPIIFHIPCIIAEVVAGLDMALGCRNVSYKYISAVRTLLYAELGWKDVLINCGLFSHSDARRLPDHAFALWRYTDCFMKQPLLSREHVYPS